MKRKPLAVYLDDEERGKLENLATQWGVSLSSAIQWDNQREIKAVLQGRGFKPINLVKLSGK